MTVFSETTVKGQRTLTLGGRGVPTVIEVVQMAVWIIRIFDDDDTSETIAILDRQVAVIPVCT